ncbi:MAG: 50S ribosomal protein L11 methyltransferase [Myxococcota bacterium]
MSGSGEEAGWRELRLLVPVPPSVTGEPGGVDAWLEPLGSACLAVSPGGVLTEDAGAPPGDEAPLPSGTMRLTVYVPETERESAEARLGAALAGYDGARMESRPLDEDWRERWKRWFHGFAVSPRLAVRPPWEDEAGPPEQQVVVLEPGMAFGTGQHETTRLCLEAVDALCEAGAPGTLLDVGCGTGILAVAAVKRGAGRVVGVDTDPDAVACASENADRNGVAGRLDLSTTPLADVPGRFPVVLANILAVILIDLADDLAAHTAAGGRLVLSGVLASQADEVLARFRQAGLVAAGVARRGEWVRLDLDRPS